MATQTNKIAAGNAHFTPPPKMTVEALTGIARANGETEGKAVFALPNVYTAIAHARAAGLINGEGTPSDTVKPFYQAYQDGKRAQLGKAYVPLDENSFGTQCRKMSSVVQMFDAFEKAEDGLKAWATYYAYCVGSPDGNTKGAGGRILRNLQGMAAKTKAEKRVLTREEMADIVAKNGNTTPDKSTLHDLVKALATKLENMAKRKGKAYKGLRMSEEDKIDLDKARRTLEAVATRTAPKKKD